MSDSPQKLSAFLQGAIVLPLAVGDLLVALLVAGDHARRVWSRSIS